MLAHSNIKLDTYVYKLSVKLICSDNRLKFLFCKSSLKSEFEFKKHDEASIRKKEAFNSSMKRNLCDMCIV